MPFKLKSTYVQVEAPQDVMLYDDGDEPFRATIRINLSKAEIDALTVTKAQPDWSDLHAVYAPHVVAWNLDVPAPAEGGPEMLSHLPVDGFNWLSQQVKLENYKIRYKVTPSKQPAIHGVPSKKPRAC